MNFTNLTNSLTGSGNEQLVNQGYSILNFVKYFMFKYPTFFAVLFIIVALIIIWKIIVRILGLIWAIIIILFLSGVVYLIAKFFF